MKRVSLLIATAVAILVAGCFLCWRQVVLSSTKAAALKEYADQRAVLNMVPTSPPKRIEPASGFTNAASVEVAGCVLALPSDRFTHDADPKRRNVVLNDSRFRMLILPCSDAETWGSIMQSVSQTNFYEFVRSVLNATEQEISKQRSMDALVRHLILLKAKIMLAPVGFEYSCIEFDRGDIRGFIIGDPARTKNLYVRFYVPSRKQFIDLGIIQKAHLQMSEIEELISLLKVKTNEPDGANRRQPLSFRERVGEAGVLDLTAAVAHLECYASVRP